MPRLMSMARSGETFITHDDRRGYWLHLPEGAGGAGPISASDAARAVRDHGFVPVERDFTSWPDLDDFLEAEAATLGPIASPDPTTFDRTDVEELLAIAREWLVTGEGPRAQRLVTQLFRAPVSLSQPDLRDELLGLLDRLGTTTPVLRSERSAAHDPVKAAAHRRWEHLELAAA